MVDGVRLVINQADVAALRRLLAPGSLRQVIGDGLVAMAYIGREQFKEYPPSPGGRPQFEDGFITMAQQRHFFAALDSGEIEVPYRRGSSPGSERLNTRWQVRQVRWDEVEIVNDTSYGPFVHGDDEQAQYHTETGWKTETELVEVAGDDMARAFGEVLERWLERGG